MHRPQAASSSDPIETTARHSAGRTALLLAAAFIALAALVACGGEAASCPPANGAQLGSAATVGCGCFADLGAGASAAGIEAALRQSMRAAPPSDCSFTPGGRSTSLAPDLSIAIGEGRHAKPAAGSDGDQPLASMRVHYAITP